jgi:hypothetical protein
MAGSSSKGPSTSVTSRLSAALPSRRDDQSAGCRRSYWDGRSAISRRRLTTKSYLPIALPKRLGIKHASALEEEFKQRKERNVPAKGNGSILPNAFLFAPENLPFLKLQAGVCI